MLKSFKKFLDPDQEADDFQKFNSLFFVLLGGGSYIEQVTVDRSAYAGHTTEVRL